ncbi:MAG: hypothetical protein KGM15_11800 [Pseudomonadota bacterium]|nr:hypothetical protein [Pseudomonadota bacterium]
MLKVAMIAAALTVAGASGAAAMHRRSYDDYGAQGGYGHGNGTSAFGRYCPPGYFPHSFPDGNGVRCERGNSYIYPAPF